MARERVLVTGGAGRIAQNIAPFLREHFALRLLDRRRIRREGDDEVVRADIQRFKEVLRACRGVTAILHLAAIPREGPWDDLLSTNVAGTYNVFEAARQAKVPKVVFASTVQTMRGHEPEALVSPDMPVRPISIYACTKVFGEALARHYADRYGMSMICLRIGWFDTYEGSWVRSEPEMLHSWCSPRDLAQLIVKSIRSDLPFGIFFGVSRNPSPRWDIRAAELMLGYAPTDNAADYFVRAHPSAPVTPGRLEGTRLTEADQSVAPTRKTSRPSSYTVLDLLIHAAFLDDARAEDAWERLKPDLEPDRLPDGSSWVMPLLYQRLNRRRPDDPKLAWLKGIYRHTWTANQLLVQNIVDMLQALHQARIETLMINDAGLVALIYKDFGLRAMTYPVILVPTKDASTAVATLQRAGWMPCLSARTLDREIRHFGLYSTWFVDPKGVQCKLKWRFSRDMLPDLQRPDDEYWKGAVPVEFGGIKTRALHASDQLLHVCVDGIRSNGPGPWIADAMTILQQVDHPVDWTRLVDQTRRYRAIPHVAVALEYLVNTLDAPVPRDVLYRLRALRQTRRGRFAFWLNQVWPGKLLARYAMTSAGWGVARTLFGFPRFLKQFALEVALLDHGWQIPLWAARHVVNKAAKRIVSRRQLPRLGAGGGRSRWSV